MLLKRIVASRIVPQVRGRRQEMRSVCKMMQHCIHENFLKHG